MNARGRLLLGFLTCTLLVPACWPQSPVDPANPAAPARLWSLMLSAVSADPIGDCGEKDIVEIDIQNGVVGAEDCVARIPKSDENAQSRCKALRYLGTVNVTFWPEATSTLIDSLLKDPSESVRLEAALALRNGRFCTDKVVLALQKCVSETGKDGLPVEKSDRVREAAANALVHCSTAQQPDQIKPGELRRPTGTAPGPRPDSVGGVIRSAFCQPRDPILLGLRKELTGRQDLVVQQVHTEAATQPRSQATPPPAIPSGKLGYVEIER